MPRRRKRRKWGSIRSESRYKHIIRWVENTPEGRKRRTHTFYGTEAEAGLWLDRKHVEVADSGDKPVPTIGRAYEMWWKPALSRRLEAGKIRKRTFDAYERAWNRHASERWSHVPVSKVKPLEVQEWVMTLKQDDARISLVVLKGIADFAVKYEAAPGNKFALKYELPDKASRSKDVYSLAEADAMLARLKGTRLEAPYILACFGGARSGEALGVGSGEVEIRNVLGMPVAFVPISRRMESTGCEPVEGLKNDQSVRVAVIPAPYSLRLKRIADAKISEGSEWLADRGDGLPMNRNALQREWRAKGGPFPFANLRPSWRTFASYDWKVPDETLELLMGHKLPGVSGAHYIRPSVTELAESLVSAYSESMGTWDKLG